jgi:hypothetical protein
MSSGHGTISAPLRGMLTTLFLIVLIVLALGSAPSWPYSRGWGYYPSGGLGLLVVLLLVVFLLTPGHVWW